MAKAAKEKDAGAAPAKGKAKAAKADKTDKVSTDDVDEVILAYMRKQNRPYSPIDVFNNLGGTISKALVARTLANLFSTGQLHGKINAKAWVYLTKQDDLECPSQADLNTLDERIKELTELVSTARDRIKHTSHQLAVDLATPTDAQLDELCPAAEKEREESSKRLGHLRSGAQTLITPQAMAQLRAETEAASTLIKKRKRKFEDIFGPIMEGTGKKRQELAEESDVSL